MKIILFIIILVFTTVLFSQENNPICEEDSQKFAECIPCDKPSATSTVSDELALVYLNGIKNTRLDANKSVLRMKKILENKLDEGKTLTSNNLHPKNVCLGYTYNQTESFAADAVETIAQKLNELNSNYGTNFSEDGVAEYLLNNKVVNFVQFLVKSAAGAFGGKPGVFSAEQATEAAILIGIKLATDGMKSEHQATVQEVKGDIVTAINEYNIPIVLVSHSQGNLFANDLVYELKNDGDSKIRNFVENRLANLQVASPANNIQAAISDYYTHTKDVMIDKVLGSTFVTDFEIMPSNMRYFDLNLQDEEDLGMDHGFVEIYTSSTSYGTQVPKIIDKAIFPIYDLYDRWVYDHVWYGSKKYYEADLDESPDFDTMENFFFKKVDKLAEKIIPKKCDVNNSTNFKFGEYGIRPVFKKDFAGNLISFHMENLYTGQKLDNQEDFYMTGRYFSEGYGEPVVSFLAYSEENFGYREQEIVDKSHFLYIHYTGGKKYLEDGSIEQTQNNCLMNKANLTRSHHLLNLWLTNWGNKTTFTLRSRVELTSFKLSEVVFHNPGAISHGEVFPAYDDNGVSDLYSNEILLLDYLEGEELPDYITSVYDDGFWRTFHNVTVNSTKNKFIVVEGCTFHKCFKRLVNVSLPDYGAFYDYDKSEAVVLAVKIKNSIPITPVTTTIYRNTIVGGEFAGATYVHEAANAPTGGEPNKVIRTSSSAVNCYDSSVYVYNAEYGEFLWSGVGIAGESFYIPNVKYVVQNYTLSLHYLDSRVSDDIEEVSGTLGGAACKWPY